MGSSLFASDLKKLDVGDVMEYRLRNFKTNNLTVLANGLALNSLETSLKGGLNSSEALPVANIPSDFVGGSVRVRADLGGDTHVAVAFPAQAGAAGEFYPCCVVACIISCCNVVRSCRVMYSSVLSCTWIFFDSSNIFFLFTGKAYAVLKEVLASRLKGNNSVGNYASAFSIPYSDGGLVGVYCASSSVSGAENLVGNVMKELKSIAASCDVTAATNKLTLSNLMALEGGCSAADIMLAANVQGLATMEYADVRDVSAKDVSAAAAAVLKSNPAIAVLGATYGLKSFDSMKSSMQ